MRSWSWWDHDTNPESFFIATFLCVSQVAGWECQSSDAGFKFPVFLPYRCGYKVVYGSFGVQKQAKLSVSYFIMPYCIKTEVKISVRSGKKIVLAG